MNMAKTISAPAQSCRGAAVVRPSLATMKTQQKQELGEGYERNL
jgi:hypothetical protein